ncbi:hypothetical protein EZS27_019544 [termite gut metagenome]|uniref:GSCFA domain-containing protein n=1 Tax=termite gut metagenome TaxID=433724 RepID=A0A5J4REF9_9ZZZZ
MNLKTPVELLSTFPTIHHSHQLLLIGSCFAENIGALFTSSKFHCAINPFGILYNPLSISTALRDILTEKRYTAGDLFCYQGEYHSLMHHSSFSSSVLSDCLAAINTRLQVAHKEIGRLNHLWITFGTAWVYMFKATGKVAGNCHKLPDSEFERRRLEQDEIVADYISLIDELLLPNPQLHLWFTVSPIRHVKDGMHGNQLSKAILLLAIEQLQQHFPGHVHYFPAYEIVMDELRNYRFYADDMTHLSSLTVQYVWERLASVCFSSETQQLIQECESIRKALAHKPRRSDSETYAGFLEQMVLKIKRLTEKYPNLDVEKELDICHTRLKNLAG